MSQLVGTGSLASGTGSGAHVWPMPALWLLGTGSGVVLLLQPPCPSLSTSSSSYSPSSSSSSSSPFLLFIAFLFFILLPQHIPYMSYCIDSRYISHGHGVHTPHIPGTPIRLPIKPPGSSTHARMYVFSTSSMRSGSAHIPLTLREAHIRNHPKSMIIDLSFRDFHI